MARRPYLRPMDGWWKRDAFFVGYMMREATAVFVAAYALILLAGLVGLARGEAAFSAWAAWLQAPESVALHAFLLAAFIYHAWTWFRIMPKTMPPVVVRGRRLAPAAITSLGIAAAVTASAVLLVLLQAAGA